MHRIVTTALDVLGLLVVATGVYFAAEPLIDRAALIPAGAAVMGVSALWARFGAHSPAGPGESS